jgi:valyl-tRNA synthetase
LARPDPQVIWPPEKAWKDWHAWYHRSSEGGGQWEKRAKLPDSWQMAWRDLRFKVQPTPLDVITEYGTDALRLALTSGNTPGNDMRLGDEKLTTMRNLVNKIWNISRYVKMQSPTNDAAALVTPADHFIADRLQATQKAVTEHLQNYNLSLAIETLREFTVSDFADWYIEMHKIEKNTALLSALLREIITLWHPLAPFVTEAIYQDMYRNASNPNDLLLVAPYQGAKQLPVADPALVTLFAKGQQLVTDIREIRNTYGIKPQEELGIQFTAPAEDTLTSLLTLAKVNPKISGTNTVTVGEDSFPALVFIDSVDIAAEKARLTKELTGAEQHLVSLTAKLQNEKFMSSAPETIRKNTELLATETTEKITRLTAALAALQ